MKFVSGGVKEFMSGGVWEWRSYNLPTRNSPAYLQPESPLIRLEIEGVFGFGEDTVMDEYAADGAYPAVVDCGVLPGRMKEYTARGQGNGGAIQNGEVVNDE